MDLQEILSRPSRRYCLEWQPPSFTLGAIITCAFLHRHNVIMRRSAIMENWTEISMHRRKDEKLRGVLHIDMSLGETHE